MTESYPILEFDPVSQAILDPHRLTFSEPAPQRAVLCFFQDVLARLKAEGKLVEMGALSSEIGTNPIYRLEHAGHHLMVVHPGVGAPLAAGFMEEVIANGANKIIACGGCGVLNKEIAVGFPVVLSAAVRDEGTSYHYLPPSREATPTPEAVAALEAACKAANQPYCLGKAWTTDAIYRETIARRAARLAEDCLVVEMEAAAFFAVASFRGITMGQIVYGGDLVVPEGWDKRGWHSRTDDRLQLFWLAVDACCRL